MCLRRKNTVVCGAFVIIIDTCVKIRRGVRGASEKEYAVATWHGGGKTTCDWPSRFTMVLEDCLVSGVVRGAE